VPSLEERYLPDDREVTGKVIDGEAIVINLLTGVYYSMEGSGARIWEGVERGLSVGDIARAVAEDYGIALERAQDDVSGLLQQLIDERMVRPAADAEPASAMTAAEGAGGYEPPLLNIYRDMAEVLALDPPTPGVFDSLLKDPT
jgi:hypothetical protein